MPRPAFLVTSCLALTALGCREEVASFSPPEVPPSQEALIRLTFGAGNELDPQWSTGGDTVLYHTDAWGALPGYRGILLGVPRDGGTAVRIAAAAQPTAAARLILPVPSPAGERLAYVHLQQERDPEICRFGEHSCPVPSPLLETGAVKARRFDAGNSTFDDPVVPVAYPAGTTSTEPPFLHIIYPFHYDYIERREVTSLRASWAPDGQRLVYSDGMRLLLWNTREAAPAPIPNTTDGVAPAWSPDGEWIAFGVLQRGTQHNYDCTCGAGTPIPVERQDWDLAARLVARIRPDGSELQILGEGSEPAWSPDGTVLYFRRGEEGLFRMPAPGGEATPIANTGRARAPAVSPDGNAVAFARADGASGDFNIWRLRLVP